MRLARPRWRAVIRGIGWAIGAIGVAVLCAWFVSAWHGVSYSRAGKWAIVINRGWVEYEQQGSPILWTGPAFTHGFETWKSLRAGWRHDLMWERPAPGWRSVGIPLWWIGVPLVLCGAGMVLICRRPKPGHCRHCGYNLAGLPEGGPCPECGRAMREEGSS